MDNTIARSEATLDASSRPVNSDNLHSIDVAALEAGLVGLHIGHPLRYLTEIGSTNAYAHERAREGAPDGMLILTDHQTAGHGRVGRAWHSLPGRQLALSLVLHPRFPPHFLVMASALSAADAVEAITGLRPDVKWPNDVLLSGKKLCGILIETSADYAIVGIGLNVNGSFASDTTLAARATTLAQALGHDVSREALAIELLRHLDEHYARLNAGEPAQVALRAVWRDRLITLGKWVTVRQGSQLVAGLAQDVDAGGALLVRGGDGEVRTITWGDVG
jgi:BirA family biotin operon repressor/biotin-[acetyl-CoA-carboxylase] ligase